ncbi:hypothetical protein SDC9_139054 [bioreactor metagenome]|uniref:Uncharacterized protein n=1 Tax=bioreactor metagenome TaxID=1076179 RepID=A0A645DR09_9ZZZZ
MLPVAVIAGGRKPDHRLFRLLHGTIFHIQIQRGNANLVFLQRNGIAKIIAVFFALQFGIPYHLRPGVEVIYPHALVPVHINKTDLVIDFFAVRKHQPLTFEIRVIIATGTVKLKTIRRIQHIGYQPVDFVGDNLPFNIGKLSLHI